MKSPTIREYLAPWERLREMAALAATARRQYADLIERAATDPDAADRLETAEAVAVNDGVQELERQYFILKSQIVVDKKFKI